MKEEHISDALNMLDDIIIKEAGEVRGRIRNRKKIISWQRWSWGIAGACLALIVCIKLVTRLAIPLPNEVIESSEEMLPDEAGRTPAQPLPNEAADLPLLTITENAGEGMGFEGYLAYDVSELVNANPWNENMEISTLPVYKNPVVYEDFCVVSGADFEKMEEFLIDVANRLGMEAGSLVITDDMPDQAEQEAIREKAGEELPEGYFNPRKLISEVDGVRIEVDVTMSARIEFDPAIALSEEYHFEKQSYESMISVAKYLQEEYKDLIGMENLQMDIYGGDYNIYGQQSYSIAFFNKGSTDEESLVNYNFNRVSFVINVEGRLWIVRIQRPELSEKMGDYPIIDVRQAKELLMDGKYITSVPYELPGEGYIAKTELIYRTGESEKYFMPYYRFYVEIPEEGMIGDGMKTYGAYYVPAVESTYISNMPVWDGGFNQ